MGSFYIPGRAHGWSTFRQAGATYERTVNKEWCLSLGYHQWIAPDDGLNGASVEEPVFTQYYNIPVGALRAQVGHKMIDLLPAYRLVLSRHDILKAGVGASYCWGLNAYVNWFSRNPNFPYDYQMTTELRKVSYWGAVTRLSYDHLFFKGVLAIGVGIGARYYPGKPAVQYDYGLHIGFNF